jgi:hypothetical protein
MSRKTLLATNGQTEAPYLAVDPDEDWRKAPCRLCKVVQE